MLSHETVQSSTPPLYSDDDARWQAVLRRDRAADGVFYAAVKTTGVYCRPSCSGRPLRKNVRFFETRAEAEAAGFRPCKRCRPERVEARCAPADEAVGGLAARDWTAPARAGCTGPPCATG